MKKPSITIVSAALLVILVGLLYSFNFIPHRQYADADFDITTYKSQVDRDGDGIDDQTDILTSARAYLATKPKYKSVYYATGYPDDQYGVCTDAVAFALKGAGYDLMELVDADVRAHPEFYDIEIPDKNIDFRRVKNLDVYFRRHAKSLTTDLSQIGEWQAGDIIVFRDHIGLIADHRNRSGVPFLIHHANPLQSSYEQDILEAYPSDYIIGHYRIS